MNHQYRAGKYEIQQGDYNAFIPVPLPPKPPVKLEGELRLILSEADRALARLDGSIQTLPDADLFVYMHKQKEAVLSNQIEGNRSSLLDLLAYSAKVSALISQDVSDVISYIGALNYGVGHLRETPLYTQLIKDIHKRLSLSPRDGGEFREIQTWIGSRWGTVKDAYFVPPPPGKISAALTNLEEFTSNSNELPPLIKVGLAHAQFEAIQPFTDGNGLIGRLLITLLLCQQKILPKPALYLSQFLKENRDEYFKHLKSVRNDGDWESWLEFFLRGIIEASSEAVETIQRVLVLRDKHRNTIASNMGRAAADANRVLEHLMWNPFVRVEKVREITETSYVAANNLIKRLTDSEILHEVTNSKRNRVFCYYSYIQILGEGTETFQENRKEDQL